MAPKVNLCVEILRITPILIIGFIAAYIAWQQYKTAKAKLNLDLFEKRYEIFQLVWSLLSNPSANKSINDGSFTNQIPKATFLFGTEIRDYMSDIWKKRIELWSLDNKQNMGTATHEDHERHTVLFTWFLDEANEGVKTKFGKYMNFENWQ